VQPSAGTVLPHTRARSVHWITTAAAVAAVVGAGTLVPTADATPSSTAHTASVKAPDPKAAHYPLDCAGAPVDVVDHVSGDLDEDGRPETVSVVRCHSETGTPPSGVYVLSAGATTGSAPRIIETLVNPKEKRSIKDLKLDGRIVRATILGYSSDSVPRCCPDQQRSYGWEWRAGTFYVIPGPLANSV
jgi:hypothetical protein